MKILTPFAILAVFAAAAGCDDKPSAGTTSSAAANSSTGAAPTTSHPPSAATTATAAPTAGAQATPGCPDPAMKGKGTSEDPCTSTGAVRMIEAKWTGKISDAGATFSLVNRSKKDINNMSARIFYYDKLGKQLENGKQKAAEQMGGGFELKANETKTMEMGWPKAEIPKDAVTIEAEIFFVKWSSPKAEWTNESLGSWTRPAGGVK